jgi:hypothetical protein
VTGTKDGKTGTASLTVTAGAVDHIVVSPTTATITAGGSQSYTAAAFDASNNSLGDVTASTTFGIAPNGSCTTATCTATVAGSHTVTGTNAGKTATATLTVNAGSLDHLLLSPATATIPEGGSQTYTAQGRDQYENSVGDVTATTVFSIAPEGSCTGATCGAALFGAHTVTGTKDTKTGTASLQVVHVNVPPTAIAASVSTAQDTAVAITLTGTDPESSPLTFTIVAAPAHGTLSGTGVAQTYTPALDYSGPDSFTFTANDGTADSNVAIVSITITPAAIRFRAAAFAQNAGASSISLTRPAGVVVNDLMLATITMAGTGGTITPPAGWSFVRDPQTSVALDHGSTAMRQVTFFRVATASEPASYNWGFGAARNASGGIAAYIGVDTGAPFDVAAGQPNTSSTSITAPSVVTRVENTRIVGFFGIATNAAITPPARMAERGEMTSGRVKVAAEIADVNQAAIAGAPAGSGSRTATASSAAANVGQLVALRPAGAAPQQPPAPATLTASGADGLVSLAWDASIGATEYRLYRSTVSGGPYDSTKLITTTTATSFVDTTVSNNTTYYYVVRGYNEFGESPNSPQASATPAVACSAITLSPATLLNGKVGVAYSQTVTANGGTSPYSFALSSGSLAPGLALSPVGVLSGTPKNGAGGKSYNFTVTALDANACSGSRPYTLVITR